MEKWEYKRVIVTAIQSSRVKRDKDGYYLEHSNYRLNPDINWREGGGFHWSHLLAKDTQETEFWDFEFNVLNRLGQEGWRLQGIHSAPGLGSAEQFIFVLMRPVE